MKQQTILCLTAQMNGKQQGVGNWKLTMKALFAIFSTQRRVHSYEDRNILIEQSAVGQTTLIEHSLPYLKTPLEKSWIRL